MTNGIQKPAGIDRYVGAVSVAQAIESFTKRSDISPVARLLGIELVSRFNPRTLGCFPSENYLAAALGVSERHVRRAKHELRDAGLINWQGGHRGHCCSYVISWRRLRDWLTEFRTILNVEIGNDDDSLVALHNKIQSIKGGPTRPPIDDNAGREILPTEKKADIAGQKGGHSESERRTHTSALLSQNKSHEVSHYAHACARGDDTDVSPRTSEKKEPWPIGETFSAHQPPPPEPTGRNGTEEDRSVSLAQEHDAAITERARRELLNYLAPSIAADLSPALFEEAVKQTVLTGVEHAADLIRRERRNLRITG